MATKSTGVGRGGARKGAGRKPKFDPAALEALNDKTVEDLMELAVRMAAANGRWDEVSKAGARLLNAKARQQPHKPADGQPAPPTSPSRFAPRPPPSRPN